MLPRTRNSDQAIINFIISLQDHNKPALGFSPTSIM